MIGPTKQEQIEAFLALAEKLEAERKEAQGNANIAHNKRCEVMRTLQALGYQDFSYKDTVIVGEVEPAHTIKAICYEPLSGPGRKTAFLFRDNAGYPTGDRLMLDDYQLQKLHDTIGRVLRKEYDPKPDPPAAAGEPEEDE